jgi:3',5'-cyclic-nucleotide phosphodiesterase
MAKRSSAAMTSRLVCKVILLTTLYFAMTQVHANTDSGFDVVALGTGGGLRASNLSAFLIGPHNQGVSVACDAGTIIDGIETAINAGSFDQAIRPKDYPLSLTAYILKEHIKGYLITHGHLDHIAGLVIASPDDSSKPIYGLESVLRTIRQSHFNWQSWPNFGSLGLSPQLAKYSYITLAEAEQVKIDDTPMAVTALPLSHNGVTSTAFIIEHQQNVVLCLGDTGPDSIEKSTKLKKVWQHIAPKVNSSQLSAIIIESSFLNDTPNSKLFGHLTPQYVNQELAVLASLIDSPELLENMPVIISHIKPSLKQGQNTQALMLEQLESQNHLKVRFIIPKQGERWHIK